MSLLNITATPFESSHHHSVRAGNNEYGHYVLHVLDVYNLLIVEGESLTAVYQTGCSFLHNEHSCPNPKLELSENGGASKALLIIDSLYESDFDNEEEMLGALEKLAEVLPAINAVEKLRELYDALNSNKPCLHDYLSPGWDSDDLDDYAQDGQGLLHRKEESPNE
jgi:hypothetical protein